MSDQEFRDRCAKVMGMVEVSNIVYPNSCEWHSGGGYKEYYYQGFGKKSDWRPDVDFNQAMMMRDKVPIFKSKRYAEVLEQITCVRADECSKPLQSHPLVCGSTLFATARQIAEAALKVLEAKEASSARTQEDK